MQYATDQAVHYRTIEHSSLHLLRSDAQAKDLIGPNENRRNVGVACERWNQVQKLVHSTKKTTEERAILGDDGIGCDKRRS